MVCRARRQPHLVHHEDNGFLFPPGDHDTLAEHLVTVLSDHTRAKAMGVRSRAHAVHVSRAESLLEEGYKYAKFGEGKDLSTARDSAQ